MHMGLVWGKGPTCTYMSSLPPATVQTTMYVPLVGHLRQSGGIIQT